MTPDDLKAWMARCGYRSQAAAGRALGISHVTFRGYYHGSQEIPRTFELACKGLILEKMLEMVGVTGIPATE